MTTRADVCSVRVCETSLSVLELLLDLGVVTTPATSPENANTSHKEEANRSDEDLSRHAHGVCIDIVARSVSRLLSFLCIHIFSYYFTIVYAGFSNTSAVRTDVGILDAIRLPILFDRRVYFC